MGGTPGGKVYKRGGKNLSNLRKTYAASGKIRRSKDSVGLSNGGAEESATDSGRAGSSSDHAGLGDESLRPEKTDRQKETEVQPETRDSGSTDPTPQRGTCFGPGIGKEAALQQIDTTVSTSGVPVCDPILVQDANLNDSRVIGERDLSACLTFDNLTGHFDIDSLLMNSTDELLGMIDTEMWSDMLSSTV